MREEKTPDFILIDDDSFNNLICVKIIELTIPGASIESFTDPEKGLKYILDKYADPNANNAILFLDINMPSLNGWGVLDRVRESPPVVQERVKIFMLSSTVDPKEKDRSENDELVSGFMTKSLTQDKLRTILADYIK